MRRTLQTRLAAALLVAAIAAGCGGIPGNARTTVLSMQELDSLSGAIRLAKAVAGEDGVYSVSMDKGRAELTIVADPSVDVLALAGSRRDPREKFAIVEGPGHGSYRSWETVVPDGDVKVLNKDGADIPELESSLAKGKVTIVDFSAKWCGPCRLLDAYLTERLKSRPDLAYRKIDIRDWESPVAQHYMSDVKALPFVIVYGKDGKEVDRIVGIDADRLEAAIGDPPPESSLPSPGPSPTPTN